MPEQRPKLEMNNRSRETLSRRGFAGAVAAGLGAANASPAAETPDMTEKGISFGSAVSPAQERRLRAYEIRRRASLQQLGGNLVSHFSNNDETALPSLIGTYSKGLPHNDLGECDPAAFQSLLDCLAEPRLFNDGKLQLGSLDPARQRRLVNPQAGFGFELLGADPQHLIQRPAPSFTSEESAAEMIELYWQAHLRDVPFNEYEVSPLAARAVNELSGAPGFSGPRQEGAVTATTLFRGSTPGDLAGPFLSQFLLRGAPFGAQYVEQRMRCPLPGIDFGTEFAEWLELQRGSEPLRQQQFEDSRRYIRNGRDLAQWVHVDVPFQAYFNAALILMSPPDSSDSITGGGMGAPMNPTNPYGGLLTQEGFGTFGAPHLMAILGEVASHALKAVWFQKWGVHRRVRPEAYGGRAQLAMSGLANYPVPARLLSSAALAENWSRHQSWLLPLAYPEGSPLHPSYGAGHATVAGACVTALKALVDESYKVESPVEPSADGFGLIAYAGEDAGSLTVGGELNKLAANIALGRNFAGIHYRSDYWQSLRLGEEVTIRVLTDYKLTYNEHFSGFRFTRFDGTEQVI